LDDLKNKYFWVIFDTCTKPSYYQDVHNILALPYDYIVRYSYSSKYLSKCAIKKVDSYPNILKDALLVYGQYESFKKGDDKDKYNSSQKMIWIFTRFAKIAHIYKDASNYYFDLILKEYPNKNDIIPKEKIIGDLSRKKQTPFNLWIAISYLYDDFKCLLKNGNKYDNWSSIVDSFHSNNIQFKSDSFWQIRGPFNLKNYELITPRHEDEYTKEENEKRVISKISYFVVNNFQKFCFEIVNREPRNNKINKNLINLSKRKLRKIFIKDESNRITTQQSSIPLRSYFSNNIRFSVNPSRIITQQESIISFKTVPQQTEWPIGPNIKIVFRIRWYQLIFGIFFLVLGPLLSFNANNIANGNSLISNIFFAGGTLSLLLGAYILFKKLN